MLTKLLSYPLKSCMVMPKKLPNARRESERRRRQADRLARILRLLELLQSREHWDIPGLALELDVSERTIHRDLKGLEAANVPLYRDRRTHRCQVSPYFRFPVPSLTDQELRGRAIAAPYEIELLF